MRQKLKRLATAILDYSGINKAFLALTIKNTVRIINYHKIEKDSTCLACDYITVEPELFEKQLKLLKKRGFNFISFDEFRKILMGEQKTGKRAVLLTFDDGSKSVYKSAYPVLREYRIPFVLFLTSEPVLEKEKNFWWERVDFCISKFKGMFDFEICGRRISQRIRNREDRIRLFRIIVDLLRDIPKAEREDIITKLAHYTGALLGDINETLLSTDEIKEMFLSGICTVQGHTLTHRSLGKCTREEIEKELAQNMKDIFSVTGRKPVSFSFPGGVISDESLKIAKSIGYEFVFSSSDSINRMKIKAQGMGNNIMIYDRTSIGSNDSIHSFWSKISGTYYFLKKR
jgi:peptidoglycan/xylan/chitin deacetylase (PgdA/CDA1 family)